MMDFRKLQKDVYQNKVDKGFNTTDVNKEFCLIYAELAEAYDAWLKKKDDVGEELADVVIVTSDNPRSEEPQQIITDILAGLKSVNEVIVEPDRELAIKGAHKIARENDVVLIAGKGHEDYQILANETIHFDDREKAREIFV